MKAILLGGSGLVGSHCLHLLLENPHYQKVDALLRHSIPIQHPKFQSHPFRFDSMEQDASLLQGEHLYCCLGTTLKSAGSREAFRKVDFDYVYRAAQIASQNGAKKLMLISSVGANPRSSSFYLRTKGEIEEAVSRLPFEEVHIFRPSFLMGARKETRALERATLKIAKTLDFAWKGPFAKYRPIQARLLAEKMIQAALSEQPGIHIHEGRELFR